MRDFTGQVMAAKLWIMLVPDNGNWLLKNEDVHS